MIFVCNFAGGSRCHPFEFLRKENHSITTQGAKFLNENEYSLVNKVNSKMQYTEVFNNTHLHYATIEKHGKVIASSRNRVGSRSRGCGYSDQTIHAERAAVKSLGDTSQLRGCILTVVRINKQGMILNSEPCYDCIKFLEKCIKKYGLLKVMYSSNEGSAEGAHDIANCHSNSRKNSCAHVRRNSAGRVGIRNIL